MKRILFYIAAVALVILIALIVLGRLSQSGSAAGLLDGRLQPCGKAPNCVCSEYPADDEHYVEPIETGQVDIDTLKQAIVELGGRIQSQNDYYVAASFESSLFAFTDDLEVRIDAENNRIHLRSAVRLGYNDMGVNRKRAQRLRELYLQKRGKF